MRIQRLTTRDKAGFVHVRAIRILQGGVLQNFTPDFILTAQVQGWCKIENGNVVLKGESDTVYKYTIMRKPGTYCAHCNDRITDETKHAHLATHAESPLIAEHPSGYRVINHYECMRV